MQILVERVPSDSVKLVDNQFGRAFQIPVESWLRSQLTAVEEFAKDNVDLSCLSPPLPERAIYKPFWHGSCMCVPVAPWCNVLKQNLKTGVFETVPYDTEFGRGTFNISLEVPHIYIGPHKKGETYSLSLSIVQMVFHPEPEPSLFKKPKMPEKKGRGRKENVALETVQALKA